MNVREEFDLFVKEANQQELLTTDVFYRRLDGKPSKKIRVKYHNGERQEVEENKPMKSVHLFDLGDGMILRVKKSKYERKQHLEFLLTLAKEAPFERINELLHRVSGVAEGKNVRWALNQEKKDYTNVTHYFQLLAEDVENEKVAKENADMGLTFIPALVGDDQLLTEGWKYEVFE